MVENKGGVLDLNIVKRGRKNNKFFLGLATFLITVIIFLGVLSWHFNFTFEEYRLNLIENLKKLDGKTDSDVGEEVEETDIKRSEEKVIEVFEEEVNEEVKKSSGGGGGGGGGSGGGGTPENDCQDTDGDLYGVYCSLGTDCNDSDSNMFPGAPEICNNIDEDCSGDGDGGYVNTPTICGEGVCVSTGLLSCVDGGEEDSCAPGSPTENPESTCDDSLDNDCDGDSDCQDSDCSSDESCIFKTLEGLDEMHNRRGRYSTAVFDNNLLEDSTNYYHWQPETLMYRDVLSGHETWRMSYTPNNPTRYFSDIGLDAWSADGKYLRVSTRGKQTNAYNNFRDNQYMGQMILRSSGDALRYLVNAPGRIDRYGNGNFWSAQIPDSYYASGNSWLGAEGSPGVFYRVRVNDTGEENIALLDMGNPSVYWKVSKFISPDGRMIIAGVDELTHYPIKIYPENEAQILDNDGYTTDREFATYGGMNGGALVSYHDQYMGGDGSWYFIMPNDPGSTANWWRVKTFGSDSDGGAVCDNSDYPVTDLNYDFGECWPENHGAVQSGNEPSPFVNSDSYQIDKTCYWSHFVPDRWGRFSLFSAVCDALPVWRGSYYETVGPGVWDISNHQYSVPSFGGSAQHHDWKGFSDWVISSGGVGGYENQLIYGAMYNESESQITVASAHTRVYGGTSYSSLVRPSQSPDGTKVAWHSEYLNSANNPDVFWSVVYYPYPPNELSVGTNGIEIEFLPPKYTERGWPFANETLNELRDGDWPELDSNGLEIGEPLYAREIEKYYVWRGTSQTGPWNIVGEVSHTQDYVYHTNEDPNNELMMLHPVDNNGYRITPQNKFSFSDNPSDGTWYYAITSFEHSGLESDELSEILRVVVNGGSIVSSQVVQAKGQKDFWTTSPLSPSNFVSNETGVSGHVLLNWTEPSDDKVRYYNIYYSNLSNPEKSQEFRIASIVIGHNNFLDWLADLDSGVSHYYGITSVDRYGNEGDIVYSESGFGSLSNEGNILFRTFSVMVDLVVNTVSNVLDFILTEKRDADNREGEKIENEIDEFNEDKDEISVEVILEEENKNQDKKKDIGLEIINETVEVVENESKEEILVIENESAEVENISGEIVEEENNIVPLRYYKFEDDYSDENGNIDGMIIGTGNFVDGKNGKGLMTEKDSYIKFANEANNYFNISDGFTFSLWVKIFELPLVGETYYLLSTGGEWSSIALLNHSSHNAFLLRGYNEIGEGSNINSISYGSSFPFEEEWVHLVFSWDGNEQILYINSEKGSILENSRGLDYDIFLSSLGFGAAVVLDEVMIYNHVLSDSEIREIYCLNSADC